MAPPSRRLAFPLILLGVAVLGGCSSRSSGPQVGEYTERRTPANVITAAQIQSYAALSTVEEILVRLVPSVEFTSSGLQIRGMTGRPLWVIDGVPMETGGGLVPVAPTDIERVEVLRDGGSTAAYGFRGGAGVILVRTKTGL